jgi:hypothetical protein
VTPGAAVAVQVDPGPCPNERQPLFGFGLPDASASGVTSGRHVLSPGEVRSYTAALRTRTRLSILVVTGDDRGCGDQVGAPFVGTARDTGVVPVVRATYDIRYPVITGVDGNVADTVNSVLKSDAAATIRHFQADAVSAGAPVRGLAPTSATQTFSVSLARPSLLSLGELYGQYNTGAAHPIATLTTFTFDLRTGHRYRLADLFRPGSRWLQALSTQSRRMLRARFHDASLDEFIDPGTTPSAANFSAWELLPSGLRITFQEYQVAPYALGMPSIVIPWSTLRPMLAANAPI